MQRYYNPCEKQLIGSAGLYPEPCWPTDVGAGAVGRAGLGASDGHGWVGGGQASEVVWVAGEDNAAALFDDSRNAVGVDDVF